MKSPYRETARAFDALAPAYDEAYGPQENEVMAWMRRESLELLQKTFPEGSRLLEIGCGTGAEAVALARAGRTVLATDLSPRMASLAHAKAAAARVEDRVAGLAVPAAGVGLLRPSRPFDGAYASFGALNCEPDLPGLAASLSRLIGPGGAFVCSVMPPCCPFEVAWFLLHGRPSAALRRFRRDWQAADIGPAPDGARLSVPTRYLSLRDLRRAFEPEFAFQQAMSLGLLLPPPYLDPVFRQRPRLFSALEPLERILRTRWPWRAWGDHVAVVFRRGQP
jgi:SAM-dependent methyltransferase